MIFGILMEYAVSFFIIAVLAFTGVLLCACTTMFILNVVDDMKERLQ